jgi:hypothetical protein
MKTFPGTGTFLSITIVFSQIPLDLAECYQEFPLILEDNVFDYYGYQSRLAESCPGPTSCPAFDISSWSGDNDQEFVDACNNDEGKVLEADYTWNCYHVFDSSDDSWTMTTLNFKRCVGTSCTTTDQAINFDSISYGTDVMCTGSPVPGSDLETPAPGSNACNFGKFLAIHHVIATALFYAIRV